MYQANIAKTNVVEFSNSRTVSKRYPAEQQDHGLNREQPFRNTIQDRLEASRKELLDLGLRNSLINHRARAKQVKVIDERASEIYRLLVQDGREMTFEPFPEALVDELTSDESGAAADANPSALEQLLQQPDSGVEEGQSAARHQDTKLQTAMLSDKLQSRLLSIHNDARTYLEEQGVNILYLALGFLHWYESPTTSEPRRAPLLLIPVELKRSSAQERFRVSYTGDDIGDNLSLVEKFKAEFDLALPEIGDADGLELSNYFDLVNESVGKLGRWKVEPNEITIGFFSFGKFLMYRDLDATEWPAKQAPDRHDIVSALLGDGFVEAESAYGDETDIDDVLAPADVHQVKDADSSQILAVLDVNAGRNLVLQGPPGTGKSQTITNIIAEAIGYGRKVLFVSEKMAALEVVKRRLDEVGLGDAVLELHSHKTNKRQVLEELDRTLHAGRPIADDPQDDIDSLNRFRDRLNAYCDAVNEPIGNTRTSFIAALGRVQRTSNGDVRPTLFDAAPMKAWSEPDYRAARTLVEELDRHLADAGTPDRNPFKASRLCDFAPSQRPALEVQLNAARTVTEDLTRRAAELATSMGLDAPSMRDEVDMICRAARRAMDAPDLQGMNLSCADWQRRQDDVARLAAAGRQLSRLHAEYDDWLIDEAWNQDLLEVRQHYAHLGSKWWRFLSGNFRRAKSRLRGLCRKPLPSGQTEALRLVDAVLDSQKANTVCNELAGLGEQLFAVRWTQQPEWESLGSIADWMVSLHRDIRNGTLPVGIVDHLSASPQVEHLDEALDAVEALVSRQEALLSALVMTLQIHKDDAHRFRTGITLKSQTILLNNWLAELERLYQVVQYNQLTAEMDGQGLGFLLASTRSWGGGTGSLVAAFDFSWYTGLVEQAYNKRPAIRSFARSQHEHSVEEFTRLDRLLFRHNQSRLALAHWRNLPNLNGGGELSIINREINKKRRHMPIRKLMTQAGRAVQAVKPVFMMSPMSVATYLSPGALDFDLVVFDEASQVKPVDAFGAILRGRQAVVVGDSKQLPPTSFFDSQVEFEDEDEFDNVGDMESILSLFLGKGAPERMLRWHYRSRHESLISVSNNEFYDNRLVVFPSPGVNPRAKGLGLTHLPETAYERGKTRSNPLEAKAVAQAAMKHARTHPELPLGIVAFSVAQRDAIEQQLELLRRQDLSCEPFYNEVTREPFFIKNLENVQGDERDVIFISVGYGKTAEGKMAMSFGPLNREGGERRLNVLISRARLAMDVFSNFKAGDIDLNRTNARGVVALRNFLAYAETGYLAQPDSMGGETDSDFEQAVIDVLAKHGIAVEAQIGTAGFFIDIGVKDPEHPGRYLLGIECDGATYHISRSARDRDRLRQEVLEGLGWRLHRIWSTEWYRNPTGELERVLDAIEQAKTHHRQQAVEPPERQATASNQTGAIERDDYSRQDEVLESVSEPYQRAEISLALGDQALHELPVEILYQAVADVVEVEAPIHAQELTRRIIEAAGLKRSGSRIQAAVNKALQFGERRGDIEMRGDFIWKMGLESPTVRDRSQLENASRKLEQVAPEEIAEALFAEVERSFSTAPAEAISGAARLLGFLRVTYQMQQLFATQLDALIKTGRLVEREGSITTAGGAR